MMRRRALLESRHVTVDAVLSTISPMRATVADPQRVSAGQLGVERSIEGHGLLVERENLDVVALALRGRHQQVGEGKHDSTVVRKLQPETLLLQGR